MSRPRKAGLDYFPLDVDFFSDRKIKVLMAQFGSDGVLLYLYILCEAYRTHGYYLDMDDDFRFVASADLNITSDKIGLMLNFLLDRSLLDSTLARRDKVLTSHGIQARYQQAVRMRAAKNEILVEKRLWLLTEEETESFIQVRLSENYSEKNPGYSEKNPSFSREKSPKESKVKDSTEQDRTGEQEKEKRSSRFIPPTVEEVRAYCKERKNNVDPEQFVAFYSSKGWMVGQNKMRNWKYAVITWEKRSHARNNQNPVSSGNPFLEMLAEMKGESYEP